MKYESIIISGLPGSGKDCLSKNLSAKLGWKIFSIGGLWREKYNHLYPNKEISFEEYWKNVDKAKQAEINSKARKIIKKGKAIGNFRYAICCKGLPVLFIFLTANLQRRAERALVLKKYKGKSVEEIKKILLQREKDEVAWGRKLFGNDYDYRDYKNYGLVIDTSDLTPEQLAEMILAKL